MYTVTWIDKHIDRFVLLATYYQVCGARYCVMDSMSDTMPDTMPDAFIHVYFIRQIPNPTTYV